MPYDVAFIGTGPDPDNPEWGESAAMAYRHGEGYRRLDNCRIRACADLVEENARAFADEFEIPTEHVYEDFEVMLAEVRPDIVSIATPVPTHAPLVIGCIRHDRAPAAIHCEKPMAATYGDACRMEREARRAGVQLTFNHQRRFGSAWREAKQVIDDGDLGDLEQIQVGGKNFFDYGTHLIDLANLFVDETAADWVLAQVDYRDENVRYGTHNENQGVAVWEYDTGVEGLALVGTGAFRQPWDHRVIGTDGRLEIGGERGDLAIDRGDGWDAQSFDDGPLVAKAIEHVVSCLDEGTEPELSATRALAATEIIFGAWESVRRRGRVEFPLHIDDNPLEDLVNRGKLTPE